MPQSSLIIALLAALLPLLLLVGALDSPEHLATVSNLFSGGLLLLGILQTINLLKRCGRLRMLRAMMALLLPLLVLGGLISSPMLAASLQALALGMLLLAHLYPPEPAAPHSARAADSPASTTPPDLLSPESNNEFFTRLSHEMRTPLNGVLGMTELLTTTPLSPRQREYVKTLQSAGNELLQRINELFDINALTSGELELEQVAFNLPELVKQNCEHFLTTSGHPADRLKLLLPQGLPDSCEGDPARLGQILHDLLGNAHRRAGRRGLIELKLSWQHDKLALRVCDDGPSVDSGERQRLLATPFTPGTYQQARLENRQPGLLRSQRLTGLMGGHFTLECPDEGGMCAHVSLPLQQVTPQDSRLKLSDARVLIADSNSDSWAVLSNHCSNWGMQVDRASSASEALLLSVSQQEVDEPYDVLLVDQNLPGGALQLATSLRADSRLPDDTVLILCGNGPGSMAARQAGYDRVLGRPVASYTLRATLDEELARLFSTRRQSALPRLQLPGDCQVLVAEDDDISARVIRGMLGRLNIAVQVVGNGELALAAMRDRRWDLVLMDCDMPVLDGFSATRQQREREASEGLAHQPIIALSAHVMEAQRERMQAAGMDDLLGKPVELGKLYRVLEQWLQRR